jgi:hypothetical protein
MAKGKPRWAELSDGTLCFVDRDGRIMARVQKDVLNMTYRYQDKEFIDSQSAMSHVEKEKFSDAE